MMELEYVELQHASAAMVEREPAPVLVLVWFALCAVVLLAAHVSFRVGKPVSRWHHPGHMLGVHVLWGFSALPASIAAGSISAVCIFDWIFRPAPPVIPWPYLPFIVVTGFCGLWAYKEFARPTLSRTPSWLHEQMTRDPELRQIVYGKRPYPRDAA